MLRVTSAASDKCCSGAKINCKCRLFCILNNEQHIQIDKNEADRNNNSAMMRNGNGSINNTIPSMETYGKINMPQYYDNCQDCERINPDILTTFKENPYTKSLGSY